MAVGQSGPSRGSAAGQWRDVPVLGRLGGFSVGADGDGVLTFDHSGVRVGLCFERIDLAGQDVGRYLTDPPLSGGGSAEETGMRFPEGAALVRHRVTYLDDSAWGHSGP